MYVIATAGHVDHGKSTLVQALTGSEPDRLAEEHRRGLSIELGYCWTSLSHVGDVAFVDVPGHERFISTMLAGIGPVPAVLFVVAADDPWMPQAAEHLAALDALGVRHGVLAVTRADLADPPPAMRQALDEISRTSLRGAPAVAVSGRTGAGIDELRTELAELVGTLDQPDLAADVRLWADRCFRISGAGTVMTGTLPAGTIRIGDVLEVGEDSGVIGTVRIRSMQELERPVRQASGVARVALGLGASLPSGLGRSSVLVTPGAWQFTRTIDVRLRGARPLPQGPVLHLGAASVSVHLRPLGDQVARLVLGRPLPLRIGDRALLRDPGSRRIWGVTVLDPAPPPLTRRGDAARRARVLAGFAGQPELAEELRRRGIVELSLLRQVGVESLDASAIATLAIVRKGWLLPRRLLPELRGRLTDAVAEHDATNPLDLGLPIPVAARSLGLPVAEFVTDLVEPPLHVRSGRVLAPGTDLPPGLIAALATLTNDLVQQPFAAPDTASLARRGLDHKAIAAAAKAGRLLRLADNVVLLPDAAERAAKLLADLAQPFTVSEARQALATTRRVVLPLLDHLDRRKITRRLPDDRRTMA